jgi:hypothetical protein
MAVVHELSNEAILDRLIKSVDKNIRPETMQRQAVLDGIALCMEWFEEARKYNTEKYERGQRKQLLLARDRLARLQRLMRDDDLWHDRYWGGEGASPRALIGSAVKRLDQKIAERDEPQEWFWRQSFKDGSPFERLFGDWLPLLYNEAGFLGGGSIAELASARGPYVKFAKCFADIYGIRRAGRGSYATASFVKAVKRFSSPPKNRIRFKHSDAGYFQQAEQARRDELRFTFPRNRLLFSKNIGSSVGKSHTK